MNRLPLFFIAFGGLVVVSIYLGTISVVAQADAQPTTVSLAPEQIGIDPDSLESTQCAGVVSTQTMTISNGPGVELAFEIKNPMISNLLLLHLDDPVGSTTFHDASENGYDGFCSGTTCPTISVFGRFGGAANFDGVDDFIQFPAFSSGGGAMSVAAWAYNRDVSVYYPPIMDFSNGPSSDNITFCWRDLGRMRWEVRRGEPSLVVDTDEVFPENEWVHVVGVVDASGMGYIYWNGILVESGQIQTPYKMIRNNQYIAESPYYGVGHFNGKIDEFLVFEYALSPEEVLALYAGGPYVDWLSVTPVSGEVYFNSSIPIQVSFDAAHLQPGTYTTTLSVSSNDPLTPLVEVPVTLTVTACDRSYLPLVVR